MKEVAPVQPNCDFTWTGFYIGAHGGYAWGYADTNFDPLPSPATFATFRPVDKDPEPDGGFGGGEVGYNYQWRHFVFGLEADFSGGDIDGRANGPVRDRTGTVIADAFFHSDETLNWLGTVRGRLGLAAFCRFLLYGTGGLAYGDVDYNGNVVYNATGQSLPASRNETRVGWCAGGGIEGAIATHWTLKVECLYYDLGDESATAPTVPPNPPFYMHYNWQTAGTTATVGLNYKF